MSDSPQLPPSLPAKAIVDPAGKVILEPPPGKQVYQEPVTVTTTTSRGWGDLLPSLIPALQSSSYVLVILTAFLAWSSRKLVTNFLDRHLELMQTVKSSLEAERLNNDKQLAVLTQLTGNNASLASTIQTLASGANRRSEYAERIYEPRVAKEAPAPEDIK